MFSFINVYAEGAAQGVSQAAPTGLAQFTPMLVMILMFVVFYFILIRPQKKKEKELKNMIAALKVGDEVATIGGIHGKIFRIKDELFVLESGVGSNKSYITVDRGAVSRFTKRGEDTKTVTPIPEAEEKTEE